MGQEGKERLGEYWGGERKRTSERSPSSKFASIRLLMTLR